MLSNTSRNIVILFALCSCKLIGQINIDNYQKKFGNGIISLKKKISINFVFNETTEQYFAKVSHKYEELHIGEQETKGLKQIPFNDYQKLNLEKARFYKLDSIGNKRLIENVKVKYADEKDFYVNNIFYSDLKVKQFNCAVDLPEDYVVSYSYNLNYKDLKFLTSFYFQNSSEAVEEVEISIKKDPNVLFSVFEFNLDDIEKFEDDGYIRYRGGNLARFQTLSTSANSSYYLPHIIISVAETKNKKEISKVLESTKDLHNWYKSLIDELNPNLEEIKNLASFILEGETNETKKIEKIFKWVQNNIQYIAFENGIAGFKPSESNKVASLKYADCKGMANLLVDLLKNQGLDARHAWIGTRANNYNYSIPSLAVDNHMICALNFNEQIYYLDATSKSAVWNKAPAHLEGKQVLFSNNDSYIVNRIEVSNPLSNKMFINGKINVDEKIPAINLQIKITGHFYRDFISQLTYSSQKNKKNIPYYFLRGYLDGIKVKNISILEVKKEEAIFEVIGEFQNIAFGDKKVIFPFLDLLMYPSISKQNPPNYIDYPKTIKANIEIVNGVKFPKETYSFKLIEEDNYSAYFDAKKVNNKFIIQQKISLETLNIALKEIDSWNSFVDQVNSINNLPITYD